MVAEITNDEKQPLNFYEKLLNFHYTPSCPSIYRVDDHLRSTKEKAYEPMIIAIGPFHHAKGHLKPMEQLKMRYLNQLAAKHSGISSICMYTNAIRAKEEKARSCYAEEIDLDADEFVEMLLLDGIFIVEFLREYNGYYKVAGKRKEVSRDNPIFSFGYVVGHILHDLMLLENQIPLCILVDLFDLSNNRECDTFADLLWPALTPIPVQESLPWAEEDHLLGLVHRVRSYSFAQKNHVPANDPKMVNIHSATELKEAGIQLIKEHRKDWLNITFKNRAICIPEMEISDATESWFRNMIAYEYYLPISSPKYVSDYAFFLHCLVHSSKDAELLRRCGIISNWLGGDARVYELIDRLGTGVQTSENFSYSDVFVSINRHCGMRRNRWMALLRRKHFNSPWTSLSLIAAAVLLSVGIVQMIFAILYSDQH